MKLLLAFAGPHESRWRDAFASALPDAALAVWPDAPAEVDCALVWTPPPELFERVRIRRAIFNLGAGVDALLSVRTLPPGLPVIRLEDAGMAAQMAQYVTLAVLRAFRESDAYAEQQRTGQWIQRRRQRLGAFGVGILGLGMLGRAVARALSPFGFPLSAWTRTPHVAEGIECFAGASGLPEVLERSRVLVVMLPSTPDTRDLIDRGKLARLPKGAHLVNVARGDIVVDRDLIAMLDSGHLASATLDVFREEPLPPNHPFWHHPRIVVTPHVSAVTQVGDTVTQVATKLRQLERGEAVSGVVDRARGY